MSEKKILEINPVNDTITINGNLNVTGGISSPIVQTYFIHGDQWLNDATTEYTTVASKILGPYPVDVQVSVTGNGHGYIPTSTGDQGMKTVIFCNDIFISPEYQQDDIAFGSGIMYAPHPNWTPISWIGSTEVLKNNPINIELKFKKVLASDTVQLAGPCMLIMVHSV